MATLAAPLAAPLGGDYDSYKSKLLRRTMPDPWDTRLTTPLGKILTVIGYSDNAIGGLYGVEDFLPTESLY